MASGEKLESWKMFRDKSVTIVVGLTGISIFIVGVFYISILIAPRPHASADKTTDKKTVIWGCIYQNNGNRSVHKSYEITFIDNDEKILLNYENHVETLVYEGPVGLLGEVWKGPNYSYMTDPEPFLFGKDGTTLGPNCAPTSNQAPSATSQ
jgi:hypothetical protein